MDKLQIYLLKETLGLVPEAWGLQKFADFKYSDVMKSLYLNDFPTVWKDEILKEKVCTIGANDYFNKWTGKEFLILEDTQLNSLFDYVSEPLANGSLVNGKKTGIPLVGGNHQLLFYNKNYVTDEPETMEELVQMLPAIQKRFSLDYGFVFPTGASYFILPFLYGYGASLWSDDTEPISYDALYKTICLLRELIYDKKLIPIKWEQEESVDCFKKGKAAYCIGGDWNIFAFDEATNHNLGICKIPKLERECRSTANASYLFVSKYLKEELYSNVYEFCKTFLTQDIQSKVISELYRMPTARNYVMDQNKFSDLLKSSHKVYERAFILPPHKEVTHMYHVFADMLEPNVLVSCDPDQLTQKVLLHLKDVDSYYTNNRLKI